MATHVWPSLELLLRLGFIEADGSKPFHAEEAVRRSMRLVASSPVAQQWVQQWTSPSQWLRMRNGRIHPQPQPLPSQPSLLLARGEKNKGAGRYCVLAGSDRASPGDILHQEAAFAAAGRLYAGVPEVPAISFFSVAPWHLQLAVLVSHRLNREAECGSEEDQAACRSVDDLQAHTAGCQPLLLHQAVFDAALAAACCPALLQQTGRSEEEVVASLFRLACCCQTNSVAVTCIEEAPPESPSDVGCPAVCKIHVRRCSALYPALSMVNHSCQPSAAVSFSGTSVILRATKMLAAGEEVTISYGPLAARLGRKERRAFLLERYGFSCCCTACSAADGPRVLLKWRCGQPQCAGRLCKVAAGVTCNECGVRVAEESLSRLADELAMAIAMRRRADAEAEASRALVLAQEAQMLVLRVVHAGDLAAGEAADSLARCLAMIGAWQEAAVACSQSVRVVEANFGPHATETALEVAKLAQLYFNAREAEACCAAAKRALELLRGSEYEDARAELRAMLRVAERRQGQTAVTDM